jgi:hypothetical protein
MASDPGHLLDSLAPTSHWLAWCKSHMNKSTFLSHPELGVRPRMINSDETKWVHP